MMIRLGWKTRHSLDGISSVEASFNQTFPILHVLSAADEAPCWFRNPAISHWWWWWFKIIDETITILLQSREEAFRKAKENIDKAQNNQKDTYDRKHLQEELPAGTEGSSREYCSKAEEEWQDGPSLVRTLHNRQESQKGVYKLKKCDGEIMK